MIQVIKKHKGLGDTVEFITETLGIAYAVKQAVKYGYITDCGCEEKKEKLNELISYGNSRKDGKILS
jgi:hypothetical protein